MWRYLTLLIIILAVAAMLAGCAGGGGVGLNLGGETGGTAIDDINTSIPVPVIPPTPPGPPVPPS